MVNSDRLERGRSCTVESPRVDECFIIQGTQLRPVTSEKKIAIACGSDDMVVLICGRMPPTIAIVIVSSASGFDFPNSEDEYRPVLRSTSVSSGT